MSLWFLIPACEETAVLSTNRDELREYA